MTTHDNNSLSGSDLISIPDSVRFDFTEEDRDDFILLCPKGSLNNATVKYMKNRLYGLCGENGCRLVMSMKDVDSIDSVGLGVLIASHKKCISYGGELVFCEMNSMIYKNMKLLTMDRYLNIVPELSDAEELLKDK